MLIEIDTKQDLRVPMKQIYELYAGRGSVEKVLTAAKAADRASATMYAHLYLGLYFEVAGDEAKAKHHMQQSAAAKLNDFYMHDVAKVHLKQRGWAE